MFIPDPEFNKKRPGFQIWIRTRFNFGSRIRIRIIGKSWIRIRFEVKIKELYRLIIMEPWRAKDAHSRGLEAQNGALEAENGALEGLPVIAVLHHFRGERDPDPQP